VFSDIPVFSVFRYSSV